MDIQDDRVRCCDAHCAHAQSMHKTLMAWELEPSSGGTLAGALLASRVSQWKLPNERGIKESSIYHNNHNGKLLRYQSTPERGCSQRQLVKITRPPRKEQTTTMG
jgi:hypothetical protein